MTSLLHIMPLLICAPLYLVALYIHMILPCTYYLTLLLPNHLHFLYLLSVQDSRKSEGHDTFEGMSIKMINFNDVLTQILSCAEQDEDIISHSLTASITSIPLPVSPKEDSVNVFLIHLLFNNDNESTYLNALPSSALLVAPPNSITSLPQEDEYVPSLMASHHFKGNPESNLLSKPTLRDLRLVQDEKDIPMLSLPKAVPTLTEGTIPY